MISLHCPQVIFIPKSGFGLHRLLLLSIFGFSLFGLGLLLPTQPSLCPFKIAVRLPRLNLGDQFGIRILAAINSVLSLAIPLCVSAAMFSVEHEVGLETAIVDVGASKHVEGSFEATFDGSVAGIHHAGEGVWCERLGLGGCRGVRFEVGLKQARRLG